MEDLTDNLYSIQPVAPRGLRNDEGVTQAISYVNHSFSASFILFEDFYNTTSHNLSAEEFLVGLPNPSCVSCFRDDDPRFVVQHTAMLRWDYHRSVERLTDTIYLISGPNPQRRQALRHPPLLPEESLSSGYLIPAIITSHPPVSRERRIYL